MLITATLRNCSSENIDKHIDHLYLEWYQTTKRIQRLTTADGQSIAIRFLGKGQLLNDGDVLYEDEHKIILVSILPCKSIALISENLLVLGVVAYEIGNKHLPLFVEENSLFMPYERTMHDWLLKNGFTPEIVDKKLTNPLNANIDVDQHKKFTFSPPKSGIQLKL